MEERQNSLAVDIDEKIEDKFGGEFDGRPAEVP